MTGELVGIGVGPGDPELLTLKAVRRLGEMEVIASIASDRAAPVAERIVAPHLPAGARRLAFRAPMHADAAVRRAFYDEVADRIGEELAAGRKVGFPCLGDPLFYGSFGPVMARLAPHFPCSVVPGVTAVQAASAALRLLLARGDECLLVLPATLPDTELAARLRTTECAAVLKVGRHLPRMRRLLAGLEPGFEAWIASRVGTAGEHLAPLEAFRETVAPYMSLLLLRRRAAPPR